MGGGCFGLEKQQTVVWGNAVESLEKARYHRHHTPSPPQQQPSSSTTTTNNTDTTTTSLNATTFINKYMIQIISILLEQSPMKIGSFERDCVEKSIRIGLQIVIDDLVDLEREEEQLHEILLNHKKMKISDHPNKEVDMGSSSSSSPLPPSLKVSPTLEALTHIFNRKKVYYKQAQRQHWHNNNSSSNNSLSEIRNQMITIFRRQRGFRHLANYMNKRAGTECFPGLDLIREVLSALETVVTFPLGSGGGKDDDDDGGGGVEGSNGQQQQHHHQQLQAQKNQCRP
jgi:hypothetical protein